MSGPRPTRLVVLDHSAKLSGAEINLTKVLPALTGFRTTVVLAEDGELVGALRARGIDTVVLPLDPRASTVRAKGAGLAATLRGGAAFLLHAVRLARLVRRMRPDVVYTNSAKAHLYGAAVARLLRVPLVCHAHDRLTSDTFSGPALRILRLVYGRLAAGVIANSRSTASTLPERAASRTAVLACPIEPSAARPRVAASGLRFAVVGRISPWKGQDLAVRAFAAWSERSSVPGSLTVIGGALFGEHEYAEALDATIGALGVPVERTGHVPPEAIADLLAQTDVLLHTSVIPEPFGQVVVEGMQAGAVVVAADAGGPAEIVTDGTDGLLYPVGDVDALAAAMLRCSESAELRDRLSTAARATAARYEVAAVVPGYEAFLRARAGSAR